MSSDYGLFASCCKDFKSNELIRQILDVDILPDGNSIIESITGYDWHISTKYYDVDVKLCSTDKRTIGDEKFAECVQAFIVYFDANKTDTFDSAKSWMPYLKEIQPAVLMLVCDSCTEETSVTRLTAQKWCIENGFELVELSPLDDTTDTDEDDFPETTGVKRIIQALHAHTWSNLVMKDRPHIQSPYMQQLMKEESSRKSKEGKGDNSCSQEITQPEAECNGVQDGVNKEEPAGDKTTAKTTKDSIIDSLLTTEDLKLFEAAGADDPGEESFEKLFGNFRLMKEKAEALPEDQRKVYAEKVALSFWKAIGGDEDEIDGLTDSDNEPT